MATVKEISAKLVAELRAKTGAGMMDCKKALEEAGGDMAKAEEILRVKYAGKADKRAAKAAGEGVIESYVHFNGKVGVLVELNCETDFVARTDEFRTLAREIAMQVASMNPKGLGTVQEEGDDETLLLNQEYIRQPSKTVRELVKEAIARLGENIVVSRAVRFEVGAPGRVDVRQLDMSDPEDETTE